MRGSPPSQGTTERLIPRFSPKFAHFCRYLTSGARGCSGVARSGGPPYPGPIWPDLARFTPSGEARDGAGVASFGLLALVSAGQSRFAGLGWPHHEWPGVGNFYFGCIWLHFVAFPISRTLTLAFSQKRKDLQGQGCEVPAFAGTTDTFAEMTYATIVEINGAMAQWAFVVG